MSVDAQGPHLAAPRAGGGQLAVLSPSGAVWRLDSVLPRLIGEICADPVAVDWDRYFPGTTSKPLCP